MGVVEDHAYLLKLFFGGRCLGRGDFLQAFYQMLVFGFGELAATDLVAAEPAGQDTKNRWTARLQSSSC